MIIYLFLPFLFFKVFVFNRLTLEYDSAAHEVVGIVHGIFLLDFGFEVCDLSIQLLQLVGEDAGPGLVLIWSSFEEGRGGG
jgi:hypothetical protein